ncbi:MAG: NTF2 fold immunity protein [Janthinobacterium lividum]
MRQLPALLVIVAIMGPVMALAEDLPQNPALAAAIAKGREHRQVRDAADATAYAGRIAAATYGSAEAAVQAPFHAVADGDAWRVTGSRPMDITKMTGPLSIVVARNDGAVREILFTAAPPGWDVGMHGSR